MLKYKDLKILLDEKLDLLSSEFFNNEDDLNETLNLYYLMLNNLCHDLQYFHSYYGFKEDDNVLNLLNLFTVDLDDNERFNILNKKLLLFIKLFSL